MLNSNSRLPVPLSGLESAAASFGILPLKLPGIVLEKYRDSVLCNQIFIVLSVTVDRGLFIFCTQPWPWMQKTKGKLNWIFIRSAPFPKSLTEISFNFSFITNIPRRLYEGTKCCTKHLCCRMKTLTMVMLCFIQLQNDFNRPITEEKIADTFASHLLNYFSI